jgi:hypothetical protein
MLTACGAEKMIHPRIVAGDGRIAEIFRKGTDSEAMPAYSITGKSIEEPALVVSRSCICEKIATLSAQGRHSSQQGCKTKKNIPSHLQIPKIKLQQFSEE